MSQSLYSSLPLESNNIRLLRILPNKNEEADINCALFVYPLHDSGRGTHRYEALSYVWGDADNSCSICVNGHSLIVRANLHSALLRLRDPVLDRIIWIDAICINQEDLNERGHQVQLMAKIYSKASQVVVWLGEAADNSDLALEEIVIAANQSEISSRKTTRKAIIALLQRPWFRRIWVLQEAAAARHILIMCGLVEIDGYAFCAGLNASNVYLEAYPRLQRLIRSVTYLMKEATLRPRYATSSSDNFSLDIRPLSELMETYYTREATDDRDKVYALLAMCSDSPTSAGLLPDYTILWEQLFQQLVRFILCKEINVRFPQDRKEAIIRSKGCVLGWVNSVEVDAPWNDTVKLDISCTDALKYLERTKKRRTTWNLPTVEKNVQRGDIVYLIQGVLKPTIIRFCKDYFSVIMIAASPKWPKGIGSKMTFPREFLLVWDLGESEKNPGHVYSTTEEASKTYESQKTKIDLFTGESYPPNSSSLSSEEGNPWKTCKSSSMRSRQRSQSLSSTGGELLILNHIEWEGNSEMGSSSEAEENSDIDEYPEAGEYSNLDDCLETGSKKFDGVIGLHNFALFLKDSKIYKRAEELLLHVIRKRKQLQGVEHPETLTSVADLQSCYREQGLLEGTDELAAMKNLLETGESIAQVSEEDLIKIASLSYCIVMTLLLERRSGHVPITEEVVRTAAANENCGLEMIELLLKEREDILITEEVLKAAAGNGRNGYAIIEFLFEKLGNQFLITEEVLKAAAGNEGLFGYAIIRFLFERFGNQDLITEEILKAAAENEGLYGDDIIQFLFERFGNQDLITEEILKAAAENEGSCGYGIIKFLFERFGNQDLITEEILKAAAENEGSCGYAIIQFLFERFGNQDLITEEILKAAAENEGLCGYDIIQFLFERSENQFLITEEILKAAVRNERRGYKIIRFLFERSENQFLITEEILKAAVGNEGLFGYEIIQFLFERSENQFLITEEILKAVVGNKRRGYGILQFLFERLGNQFLITEEILKIAVGNEGYGDENIIIFLFERLGNKFPITENTLQEILALGAKDWDPDVVKRLSTWKIKGHG
ncbi:het domain protein [Botrytis cinerea]